MVRDQNPRTACELSGRHEADEKTKLNDARPVSASAPGFASASGRTTVNIRTTKWLLSGSHATATVVSSSRASEGRTAPVGDEIAHEPHLRSALAGARLTTDEEQGAVTPRRQRIHPDIGLR